MPLCNIESDRHLNEVPIIYSFDIQFPKSVHKVSWRCIYGSESIKQILSTTELYSVIYVCNAAGTSLKEHRKHLDTNSSTPLPGRNLELDRESTSMDGKWLVQSSARSCGKRSRSKNEAQVLAHLVSPVATHNDIIWSHLVRHNAMHQEPLRV